VGRVTAAATIAEHVRLTFGGQRRRHLRRGERRHARGTRRFQARSGADLIRANRLDGGAAVRTKPAIDRDARAATRASGGCAGTGRSGTARGLGGDAARRGRLNDGRLKPLPAVGTKAQAVGVFPPATAASQHGSPATSLTPFYYQRGSGSRTSNMNSTAKKCAKPKPSKASARRVRVLSVQAWGTSKRYIGAKPITVVAET
jgi:hypothetical protein